jgi:hypothetical protein
LGLLRKALKEHEAGLNLEIAKATYKRKRASAQSLTKRVKEVGCIIHDLEYPSWTTAEEYLLRYMRKRGVQDEDCIQDVRAELNSEYHGATEEELARWRTPVTMADQRKRNEAQRFITEFSLHGWLQNSNEVLGKAPSSSHVVTKYASLAQQADEHVPETTTWTPSVAMTNRTRSFLKRWRRRWAVKYRKLPLSPTLTDTEARQKAPLLPRWLRRPTIYDPAKHQQKNKPKLKQNTSGADFGFISGLNSVWNRVPKTEPNSVPKTVPPGHFSFGPDPRFVPSWAPKAGPVYTQNWSRS